MKILCRTLFDCSFTGVVGHYHSSEASFVDRCGQPINNQTDWNRSRNQQRNYETILQLIGLKTQPQDITVPQKIDNAWQLEFTVEADDVFGPDFVNLIQDCEGVPMMTGLGEQPAVGPVIITEGPNQNIWYKAVNN